MAIIERGRSYYVKVHRGGGRYQHVGSFPWDDHGGKRGAKDAAVEAESRAKRKRHAVRSDETCREFAERWLTDFTVVKKGPTRGRHKSAKTIQNYRQELKSFLADHGSLRLSDVDRSVARQFANAHPRASVVVRNMFADAFDDKLVESNVFAGLQLPQGKGRSMYEAISAEQRLELAAHSNVHGPYGPIFEAYVNAAGLVGWRLEEGLNLQWGDLRPRDQEVDLRVTKFDKPRTVLLLPEAWEWLRTIPRPPQSARNVEGERDDYVFRGKRGTRLTRGNHQTLWEPVRGAWWATLDDAERERLVDFDFHSLRHHCAHEFYVVRGFGSELTAYQLGHSDPTLIESRYGKPWQGALDRLKRVAAGADMKVVPFAPSRSEGAESA